MYPDLYYAFKDLFGVEWHWLEVVRTFGMFMAIAFLLAAYVLAKELKRKTAEGKFGFEEEPIIIGKPVNWLNLAGNFIFAFLFGYKIIGALVSNVQDTEDYIFSLKGNLAAGIIAGILIAGSRYSDVKKQTLPKPEKKIRKIYAYERIGEITMLAAVFGFAGAKIFNSLENWDDFLRSPLESLFSFSGLTFYGGLICAALAIWWYAKKHHLAFWQLNDAAAPVLILAYAAGRIGCQVSGDGDWGIANTAYYADETGKVLLDTNGKFAGVIDQHPAIYANAAGAIRHLSVQAPSFLPDWLFAYSYPHNVNNVGINLANCVGRHCNYLPVPVFPTPLYEIVMSLIIFAALWFLRKRIKTPGVLFSLYLILNGAERFTIEKIRVNTTYSIFGYHPTQAELISFLMIITGIICAGVLIKKYKERNQNIIAPS